MGWIKKGNVIALAAAAGLMALLTVCFLDSLVKRALVAAAQAAVQAKVDIVSVDVRVLRGSLLIEGFAAADKSEPMKNLLEFERASLAFKPSAALRGKVVISDASLSGLRFGTPRKASGLLPRPEKPSALERMARRALASEEGRAALSKLSQAKSALSGDLDPSRLKSLAGLDEAQKKFDEVSGRWKEKAIAFKNFDKDVAAVQAELKSLGQGGSSPADIARKIQALQQAQAKLKALRDQVQSARKDLEADLGLVKEALNKAEELKRQDLNGLLAAAGLPSLDADSLTKRLLGPALSQKLGSALYWVNWAKTKSAGSAAKKAPQRPRRAGVDVTFPTPGADPAFLLEKASIDGRLAAAFQGKDLDLGGTLTGVTSDAPLYGKPARLSLKGAVAGGPRLSVEGRLDQTRSPGAASVSFDYAAMPLAGLILGDDEMGALVSAGAARLNGQISSQGELWKGEILIEASGLALDPKLGLTGETARLAASALRGIKTFKARVAVEGAEDDLRFTLSSDLGRALAEGLKGAFSAELAVQRKALEAKLDALYAGKAKDLQAQAGRLQTQLLGPLDAQQGLIEKALKDAAGKSLGTNPLERLKGLFR
jgi:uncharacterized protein (TIGR03545 family)